MWNLWCDHGNYGEKYKLKFCNEAHVHNLFLYLIKPIRIPLQPEPPFATNGWFNVTDVIYHITSGSLKKIAPQYLWSELKVLIK